MNELATVITIIAGIFAIIGGLYAFSRWASRHSSQMPGASQAPTANSASSKPDTDYSFPDANFFFEFIGTLGIPFLLLGLSALLLGLFAASGSIFVIGIIGLIISGISFAVERHIEANREAVYKRVDARIEALRAEHRRLRAEHQKQGPP